MGSLRRTGALVGRPVMYRDIRLGVAVDALLDGLIRRLVGLDVLCGDGAHRFLPFPACDVLETHLSVDSALVFLERDVDFYRAGGRPFSTLQGLPVRLSGLEVGALADVSSLPPATSSMSSPLPRTAIASSSPVRDWWSGTWTSVRPSDVTI